MVDAAVAAIFDGVAADATRLPRLGKLHGVRDEPLDIGEAVTKVGRTTRLTRGFVTAVELDSLRVDMDIGRYLFDRQIEIGGRRGKPFSPGGDSGVPIVDTRLRASGLLFAWTDLGTRTKWA